jgi:hypothetical protein
MELVLNLAWIVLAALMLWLWMRHAPRQGADLRTQVVALTLVILILFPVISVTDDLMTAPNFAETDCCQRKGHVHLSPGATLHLVAELILPARAENSSRSIHSGVPGDPFVPSKMVPALDSVQNRPPPAA